MIRRPAYGIFLYELSGPPHETVSLLIGPTRKNL